MNIWRWLVGLALLLSLLVIAASAWFGWGSELSLRTMRSEWRESPHYQIFPLDSPESRLLVGTGYFFSLYLTGVLILYSLPRQVRRIEHVFTTAPARLLRLLLLGLIAGLLAGVVGLTATMTMVTFPLIFFLGSILFLSAVFGLVTLSYALGRGILNRAGWLHLSPLFALFFGLSLLLALGELPYLGIPIKFIFVSLGVGAIIATRFGSGQVWDLSILTEE